MRPLLFDVSLRDGIQMSKFIPTQKKLQSIEHLIKSGIRQLEVTSFSKTIDQFHDSDQLINNLEIQSNVDYYALIPNTKGYQKFCQQHKIKNISLLTSTTDNFSLKNVGKTCREQLDQTTSMLWDHRSIGLSRVYISGAFEENQNIKSQDLINELVYLGVDQIVISDTTGKATQEQITNKFLPFNLLAHRIYFHFHGPSVHVINNIRHTMKLGFWQFDTSLQQGWCPSSPYPHSNPSTLEVNSKFQLNLDDNHLNQAKQLLS